ncbi:Heat-inducible transcription repressor HrcA [Alteracholeplasma palmae J233]|uniref:Heat-inducible transcription repressor HrcA n=1 Tax=Alteracholeplasma palmae (strain ATCC 49389 / J233) TaxID=1318466 RepID=U4KKN2_ALTPJ|nr:heat-inducible transcriptional repressor HrcA [Alteracholeplasma palmae]CCV64207.1 Heat-inducible transcription repressor HrcA [Alteracholeplasma palmae J233]
MLTDRQKLILKAIVEIYAEDAQPVGSKILTNLPYLDFSSATIRYDMAQLEDLGFLEKTHTSSGRIPSQKGYKYYVNHLVTRDQEISQMYPLIDEIFAKYSLAKEQAIKEALELLSNLTNYTAMAVGPDVVKTSKIQKIDFIPLDEMNAVMLIVTNHGHVQHQNISLSEKDEVNMNDLKEVIKTLNDLLKDKYLYEASNIIKAEFAKEEIGKYMKYQSQIVESFIQAFAQFASDNFYLSGVTNIFEQPEFNNVSTIKRFVDMLDRRELVNLVESTDGLTIKFADDMKLLPLENYSVVSIPYKINEEDNGTIAIFGPARMEYKKVIPLLEYIAVNLAKLYKK